MQQSDQMHESSAIGVVRPFRGRPLWVQLATVVFGFTLGVTVYVLMLYFTGRFDAIVGVDAASMAARKEASIVASLCLGVYFGIAYTRALGGPALNIFCFAFTIAGMQFVAGYALSSSPFNLGYGAWRLSGAFYADGITIGLPGILIITSLMTVWENHILDKDTRQEWHQRHYPKQFIHEKTMEERS